MRQRSELCLLLTERAATLTASATPAALASWCWQTWQAPQDGPACLSSASSANVCNPMHFQSNIKSCACCSLSMLLHYLLCSDCLLRELVLPTWLAPDWAKMGQPALHFAGTMCNLHALRRQYSACSLRALLHCMCCYQQPALLQHVAVYL